MHATGAKRGKMFAIGFGFKCPDKKVTGEVEQSSLK